MNDQRVTVPEVVEFKQVSIFSRLSYFVEDVLVIVVQMFTKIIFERIVLVCIL
jgi:hypothetical protein